MQKWSCIRTDGSCSCLFRTCGKRVTFYHIQSLDIMILLGLPDDHLTLLRRMVRERGSDDGSIIIAKSSLLF